ncbi:MAG TPA: tyrosine-type recombinase/integrase [Terriglobales bacterium]|nr:tyrosine-type recombinase/integrase [Terriglobales bacterium]
MSTGEGSGASLPTGFSPAIEVRSGRRVTTKVLCTACQRGVERAGLEHKHIHPHTLRRCFATHLLEVKSLYAKRAPPEIVPSRSLHKGALQIQP